MKTIRLLIVALAVLALAGCGGIFKLTPLDEYEALEQAEKAGAAAKITELATATVGATGDVVAGVDVSDTSMAATGTTKQYPFSVLSTFFNSDLAVDDLITLSGRAKGSTTIADPNSDITATTIDGALTEFAAAIELNTAKYTPTAGTYIDVSNGQVTFDPTEILDVVWGASSDTSQEWTWDTGSGTDPTMTVTDDGFTFNKPVTSGAVASPGWEFLDSNSGDTDKAVAKINANAETTTQGAVDADIFFSVLQGGSWTEVLRFDESDDQWESTKVFDFAIKDPNSDITATTIQATLAEFAAAIELNTAKVSNVNVTLGTTLGNNLLGLSTQEITLDTQTANYGFFGPASGGAAVPAFRAMVAADIPNDLLDSQHYVAASIDNEHLADDAVNSDEIADGAVDAIHISDWYAYDTLPIAWAADGTSPPDALDDRTTRKPYQYRTFASGADEDVNFVWFVPSDLSGTTIQFRVKYLVTHATGPSASEGVAFGLSGVSIGDNDATNGTKGTVVVVTDDTLNAAQHDLLITGWSGDVTVTNLAAGEIAELAFIRDVSDAVDDYGQVVGVVSVEIRYVQNVAK